MGTRPSGMAKTRVCALVALMISVAAAFSPASMAPLGVKGPAARNARRPMQGLGLRMMADEETKVSLVADDADAAAAAASKAKSSKSGGVSDSMRAKLLKENQALGGDPDAPAVNFAVVIGGFIATLLLLGNL